jgi:acyl-CoA synthetase (AMP-forming)/AMP-acid ligase II
MPDRIVGREHAMAETGAEIGTIPAAVRAAAAFGEREAVVDGDRRVPYRDLVAGVRRAAAAYLSHGVGPGDRVAVWAPNSVEQRRRTPATRERYVRPP